MKNFVDSEIGQNSFYAYRLTKNQRLHLKSEVMFNILSHSSNGAYLLFNTTGNSITIKFRRRKLAKLIKDAIKKLGFKRIIDVAIDSLKKIQTFGHRANIIDYIEVFADDELIYSKIAVKNKIKIRFNNKEKANITIKILLPLYFPIGIKSVSSNGKINVVNENIKTWLALGDSITQGFDANQPTKNYVSLLAQKLNLNALNQGVGGHYFDEKILVPLDKKFEFITVLYGTNDYDHFHDLTIIKQNIDKFFQKLINLYPDTKVFAITPIWRNDNDDLLRTETLSDIRNYITEVVKQYPNITLINGLDLIDHDAKYYDDGFLHPNKMGFEQIANRLYEFLK